MPCLRSVLEPQARGLCCGLGPGAAAARAAGRWRPAAMVGRFRGLHGCGARAPTYQGTAVVSATVSAGWRRFRARGVAGVEHTLAVWYRCCPGRDAGEGVLCGAHLRPLLRRFLQIGILCGRCIRYEVSGHGGCVCAALQAILHYMAQYGRGQGFRPCLRSLWGHGMTME